MNAPESKIPNRSGGGRFVYDKDGNFVSHKPCTKVAATKPEATKPEAPASAEKSAGKRPK